MKKIAYLIPVVLLLTSCEMFRIGFTNEQHEPGVDGGASTSQKTYTESYSYYSGDSIDTEGKSVAHLTFNAPEGLSDIAIEKVDELVSCDVDGLYAGAVEASNVGTRADAWLFIGTSSSYADGYLTLGFNSPIKDVLIEATPYYYVDSSWNDDKLIVDEGVCVAVNTSGYIKLSSLTNDAKTEVNTSECRYHFQESQTQIKIKAGGQKAFIKKITLYY